MRTLTARLGVTLSLLRVLMKGAAEVLSSEQLATDSELLVGAKTTTQEISNTRNSTQDLLQQQAVAELNQQPGIPIELNAFEAAQLGYLRHSSSASVILSVAYTAVFIVGIVGNSFVIAIVCKSPRMRTVTNYFIANLAFADILVLLFCLPATLMSNLFIPWVLGLFVCKTVSYLQGVAVSASINTMLVVTMDRFLAICFPMDWHMSRRLARWTIACIWLFSLSISLPWALYFTLTPYLLESDKTIQVCAEDWPSAQMGVLYFVVANLILNYLFPLVVIIVCYLGIWYKIERRNIPGDQPQGGLKIELIMQKSKLKVIKMMMVVVIIFLLSWFPLYLMSARTKLIEEHSVWEDWIIEKMMPLAQWLGASNSCINPILYTFFNRKYKQGFIELLRYGFCCGPSSHTSASSSARQAGLCGSAEQVASAPTDSNHVNHSGNNKSKHFKSTSIGRKQQQQQAAHFKTGKLSNGAARGATGGNKLFAFRMDTLNQENSSSCHTQIHAESTFPSTSTSASAANVEANADADADGETAENGGMDEDDAHVSSLRGRKEAPTNKHSCSSITSNRKSAKREVVASGHPELDNNHTESRIEMREMNAHLELTPFTGARSTEEKAAGFSHYTNTSSAPTSHSQRRLSPLSDANKLNRLPNKNAYSTPSMDAHTEQVLKVAASAASASTGGRSEAVGAGPPVSCVDETKCNIKAQVAAHLTTDGAKVPRNSSEDVNGEVTEQVDRNDDEGSIKRRSRLKFQFRWPEIPTNEAITLSAKPGTRSLESNSTSTTTVRDTESSVEFPASDSVTEGASLAGNGCLDEEDELTSSNSNVRSTYKKKLSHKEQESSGHSKDAHSNTDVDAEKLLDDEDCELDADDNDYGYIDYSVQVKLVGKQRMDIKRVICNPTTSDSKLDTYDAKTDVHNSNEHHHLSNSHTSSQKYIGNGGGINTKSEREIGESLKVKFDQKTADQAAPQAYQPRHRQLNSIAHQSHMPLHTGTEPLNTGNEIIASSYQHLCSKESPFARSMKTSLSSHKLGEGDDDELEKERKVGQWSSISNQVYLVTRAMNDTGTTNYDHICYINNRDDPIKVEQQP